MVRVVTLERLEKNTVKRSIYHLIPFSREVQNQKTTNQCVIVYNRQKN